MRKLIALALLAASLFCEAANAQNIKLVCQNFDGNYIVGFGRTIRLTLNLPDYIVWDDRGVQSRVQDTGSYLIWRRPWRDGTSAEFQLDRTTLTLDVMALAPGNYQCQMDTREF